MIHQLWHGLQGGSSSFNGGFLSPGYTDSIRMGAGLPVRGGLGPLPKAVSYRGGLRAAVKGPLKVGWDMSFKGNLIFSAPMAAATFALAPEGHKVSSSVGVLTSGAGALIGGVLFGTPGAVVGGFLADEFFSKGVTNALQIMHDLPRDRARVNFTGGFQDSRNAFTMRQRAANELSGSLYNARAYLGQEGSFLHS